LVYRVELDSTDERLGITSFSRRVLLRWNRSRGHV